MASSNSQDAFQRAGEFNDSLLGIPWYADDSMFFLMRYGHQAKTTLRKKDYDDFMKAVVTMGELFMKPAESSGGVEERARLVKEQREAALECIKDYPDLVRDFDRFISSSKTATRGMLGGS